MERSKELSAGVEPSTVSSTLEDKRRSMRRVGSGSGCCIKELGPEMLREDFRFVRGVGLPRRSPEGTLDNAFGIRFGEGLRIIRREPTDCFATS